MTVLSPNVIVNEVIDFLSAGRSSEEILAFQPSEILSERLSYLLERNREAELTDMERAELEEFLWLDHFISMLKLQAQLKIQKRA
jgi:hypothetical protein